MKVIVETIDNERYLEVVLSDFNMDLLDEGKLITKQITIGKQKFSFAVRKETNKEKYEEEDRS